MTATYKKEDIKILINLLFSDRDKERRECIEQSGFDPVSRSFCMGYTEGLKDLLELLQ